MTGSPEYLASQDSLRTALDGSDQADWVLLAAHALRVGSLDYAAAVCESYAGKPGPALVLTHAAALFGSGQQALAIAMVDGVLNGAPDHLTALFYRAQMAQHSGDRPLAISLLLRVLQKFPDFPGAQGALASLQLPGPSYRDVLRRIHERLKPRSYLEIGIETGATLGLAQAERVIGIDPDRSKLRADLVPPQARVFHLTSDDFFASHQLHELWGTARCDLAFIDGMHWFEYALRDFINVEAWSHPGGTVILHDCLPVFPATASRERRTKFWVGDVWKVVSVLRELRPELRIKLIATAPSGLCVVRGLDPSSRVLRDAFDDVVERYRDLPYPVGPLEVPIGFELVPASESGLDAALR